jgi:hypothetical protein
VLLQVACVAVGLAFAGRGCWFRLRPSKFGDDPRHRTSHAGWMRLCTTTMNNSVGLAVEPCETRKSRAQTAQRKKGLGTHSVWAVRVRRIYGIMRSEMFSRQTKAGAGKHTNRPHGGSRARKKQRRRDWGGHQSTYPLRRAREGQTSTARGNVFGSSPSAAARPLGKPRQGSCDGFARGMC